MRKIRVCQLITELGLAGAERIVYQLATRLDRDRFDVSVVALRGGRVARMLEDAGVTVRVVKMRGKWDAARLMRLPGILRELRPDIVHTHLFHADMVGRVMANCASVRHVVHTVHVVEGRFRPWQFFVARMLNGLCDKTVCVSRAVMDFHSRKSSLPRDGYMVIPNGTDAGQFAHDPVKRRNLRDDLGVGKDRILVGFVGRLDYQKGVETLLSTMSHLAARGEPMDLVIAGDGPKRALVENFVRHGEGGKHCRYLGSVDDVQAVYSAMDVMAMPSRWEGLSLVATEAMAASLPIVATRAPGLEDIIVDGETGIIVEPNDVFQMAERILELAADADLRRRLGASGRKRVIEEYSIAAMIAMHEQLYAETSGDLAGRDEPRIDAGWDD